MKHDLSDFGLWCKCRTELRRDAVSHRLTHQFRAAPRVKSSLRRDQGRTALRIVREAT